MECLKTFKAEQAYDAVAPILGVSSFTGSELSLWRTLHQLHLHGTIAQSRQNMKKTTVDICDSQTETGGSPMDSYNANSDRNTAWFHLYVEPKDAGIIEEDSGTVAVSAKEQNCVAFSNRMSKF